MRTVDRPVGAAAAAGFVASFFVFGIQLALHLVGVQSTPAGIALADRLLPGLSPVLLWLLGPLSYALAGLAWGALYGALVRRSTWKKGMLFGVTPGVVALLFAQPLAGQHLPGGMAAIVTPLFLNMLWGACTGGMTPHMHLRHVREMETAAGAAAEPAAGRAGA